MALGKLFGTDGIRGNINNAPLLPENITLLGRILGLLVRRQAQFFATPEVQQLIVIGRDTRASGLYLESALLAGITAMGVRCELVGVLPTAAVAQAALRSEACFGVIISASHNPFHDNGLKIFGPTGFKIDEKLEKIIEELYFAGGPQEVYATPGTVSYNQDSEKAYRSLIGNIWENAGPLNTMRLAIDCAHGAASYLAPAIFGELTSKINVVGSKPDGTNINRGFGSEAPHQIKNAVLNFYAHLGIAFDGDADRVIFVDEKGWVIDGDAILAAMAIYLKKRGSLAKNTLVTTIMSSVALEQSLLSHNIKVIRTSVGDKYVAQAMVKGGYNFGGENSGHIIIFPQATTGDGIVSALMFLKILAESGQSASELVSFFEPSPRLLKNISVNHKLPLYLLPKTRDAIHRANNQLKDSGRVLLRYSGTENKVRLLVEADSENECHRIAEEVAKEFSDEMAQLTKNEPQP